MRNAGGFITRVFLILSYFVIFCPLGLVMRLVKDPLCLVPRPRLSYWHKRDARKAGLDDARRGF